MMILLSGAIISAVSAAGGTEMSGPVAGLPGPIYTRQSLFAIPFRMNPAYPSARTAAQVLLYVSTDRGRTWQFHSRTEPDKGQFIFRAGNDGEYWFLIRTAGRGVQVQPPVGERPGLRVVVDTVPPKLDLSAERGSGGQIVVRWQIAEPHLKPESLRIQYRAGPDRPWQPVAIRWTPKGEPGQSQTGEALWWHSGEPQRVEIRGEVADLAGNTAVSHAQVGTTISPAGTPPKGEAADAGESEFSPRPPRGPHPPELNAPSGATGTRVASSQWRPIHRSPSRGDSDAAASPSSPTAQARPAADPSLAGGDNRDAGPQSASTLRKSQVRLPFAGHVATPSDSAGARQPGGSSPAERCRFVNALTFALDYDLEATSLAPGDQVVLWGTRDGGHSWSSFGADRAGRSPFVVTVKEEGVYGFRIRVARAGASAGQSPPTGLAPDIWVVVRLAKPQAADLPGPTARIRDVRPPMRDGR
jgi:hypothetical protein